MRRIKAPLKPTPTFLRGAARVASASNAALEWLTDSSPVLTRTTKEMSAHPLGVRRASFLSHCRKGDFKIENQTVVDHPACRLAFSARSGSRAAKKEARGEDYSY
jgi:hypothetical protein